MQNAPIVQLPEQKHPHDWGVIIATVAILLVAIFAVVMITQPDLLLNEPAATVYTNPELGAFERYQAEHPAIYLSAPAIAGAENPELFSYNSYAWDHPSLEMLRENPEVRQFLQRRESR